VVESTYFRHVGDIEQNIAHDSKQRVKRLPIFVKSTSFDFQDRTFLSQDSLR